MKAWIRFRPPNWAAYSDPIASSKVISQVPASQGVHELADIVEALGYRLAQGREDLALYERMVQK